jgi:hypothetical protein
MPANTDFNLRLVRKSGKVLALAPAVNIGVHAKVNGVSAKVN